MAVVSDKNESLSSFLWRIGPGIALSGAVAIAALLCEPMVKAASGGALIIPPMVIALVIGIALNSLASRPAFDAGLTWCVKKLLRIAIALLGLKVALGDIAALGLGVGLLVIMSMAFTLASGFVFAKILGCQSGYGALAGAATAVCGASATLATATVVPDYRSKAADVAFTVVAANGVSTLVMIAYPALCAWIGFSPHITGIMLGATIHDVAQVAGAGYAVSDSVGTTAVIVKLYRVFLLLPAVLAVGWWFTRAGNRSGEAKVPIPMFAVVFLLLALINSAVGQAPSLMSGFAPVKAIFGHISTWGLLLAIAALGLGTSARAILAIGWRHIVVFLATTFVLLFIITAGLLVLG